MKKFTLVILFALVFCVLASCNTLTNPAETSTQNHTSTPVDDIGDDTHTNVTSGNNVPVGDNVALVFDDYSEFIAFSASNEVVFIDIKNLLNLPVSSKNDEQVIIENDEGFQYSVCSYDANGKKYLDYVIIVSYNPNFSEDELTNVSSVNSFDELKNAAPGAYKIHNDGYFLTYGKGSIGYYSASLILGKYKIRINFGGNEISADHIQNKCGAEVAAWFSCNEEEITTKVALIQSKLPK